MLASANYLSIVIVQIYLFDKARKLEAFSNPITNYMRQIRDVLCHISTNTKYKIINKNKHCTLPLDATCNYVW